MVAVSVISLAWSIGTVVVGVGGSLWAGSKVANTKIANLKEDIDELKAANAETQRRLLESEREIALTLKAIEVKLGELATTVAIWAEINREHSP